MITTIVIVSKVESYGQIFWINCNRELDQKFLMKLGDDPDAILMVNPTHEWAELNFNQCDVVNYLPGVTDNPGLVLKELIQSSNPNFSEIEVFSGGIYWNEHPFYFNKLIFDKQTLLKTDLINGKLPNPVAVSIKNTNVVKYHPVKDLSLDELYTLSSKSKWAFSKLELEAIKNYYHKLDRNASDIELEIIAQTWSEHCKHKIFNAKIKYSDEKEIFEIDSLYKTYIKGSTFKINKPWAVSVFNDNAGIVDWVPNHYLAIKVETHNSPSALDPYGGAITGILGVNRDILGTGLGFKPIANTNVFCVGEFDEQEELPKNIIHPKKILYGVHKGIQDGGNKSGIPTVNGAMAFNENFSGKPLIYCGTVGIAPKKSNEIDNKGKYHKPGHLIVMAGGLVGLDGIHGATMSSIALDQTVPHTMVQIGDPYTQKKLADFILSLRDLGVMTSITDNGAGGISSSIGEMAEKTNGAKVFLNKVPLKYQGLAPWEIFVSESQERMTFAIEAQNQSLILELSQKFGVITNIIGEFTETGKLEIIYNEKIIADLDLSFLHDGNPKLNLEAVWDGPKLKAPTWKKEKNKIVDKNVQTILNIFLNDRNISSKEYFIKQYDQEVMAATIVKPLEGINYDSPNDSGLIWLKPHGSSDDAAVAISSGIQYHFSHFDTELMAKLSFDEAVRGVIATGANPDYIAITDNFCWPDPIYSSNNPDGNHKLAQLVRACRGLHDMALAYQIPMISGKDSMKNDFIDESIKISVPPTLLITAMGLVNQVSLLRKSQVKSSGKLVYQIGLNFSREYFGHFLSKYFDYQSLNNFEWNMHDSIKLYKKIFQNIKYIDSIHDISEGGMLVALSESLFLNKLGINFDTSLSIEELFSEYPSQFIISIDLTQKVAFENEFIGNFKYLGTSTDDFKIKFQNGETIVLNNSQKIWRNSWT